MSVRKAVFPVAGMGTRFLPATKVIPKEMLPIVDRPALQYVVEEAVKSGIEQMVMITSRGKRTIEDHFDRSPELARFLEEKGKQEELQVVEAIPRLARFVAVRQQGAHGLGHAILQAEELVAGEPFAIILPDDQVDSKEPALAQLLRAQKKYGGSVLAVQRVPRDRTSAYGIVDCEPVGERTHRIRDMVEKPDPAEAPSDLAIIGRYVLSPRIFHHLRSTQPDHRGEIQLTDGLRAMLQEEPIFAYEFEGVRYDTGDKLGFLQATVAEALKRPDLGAALRPFLREILEREDRQ